MSGVIFKRIPDGIAGVDVRVAFGSGKGQLSKDPALFQLV